MEGGRGAAACLRVLGAEHPDTVSHGKPRGDVQGSKDK